MENDIEKLFEFKLLDNGTYSVVGRKDADGKCLDIECADIPASYKGKPVTEIGIGAFAFCHTLKSVNIPDSITTICSEAFKVCEGLKSIVIPDSVICIHSEAFYACLGLESVIIGNGVTDIFTSAFAFCKKLTQITIGSNVSFIGMCAFFGCDELKSVTVPIDTILERDKTGGSPFPAECDINRKIYDDDEDLKKFIAESFGDNDDN